MKKNILKGILIFCCAVTLTSCGSQSPEKIFGIAVLNTNLIVGFGSPGFSRELESPSVKMPESGGEPVPMKRSEIVNSKIDIIEENYDKVKSLRETDDSKDMINASLKLYEFVIPVYKTEYVKLAELYDNNAPEDQIQTFAKSISDKYYPGFNDLYSKVISTGKEYAEKNSIKVNWGDK